MSKQGIIISTFIYLGILNIALSITITYYHIERICVLYVNLINAGESSPVTGNGNINDLYRLMKLKYPFLYWQLEITKTSIQRHYMGEQVQL